MLAATGERQARAVEQVVGRCTDQDLARAGQGRDTGGGVHGQPAGLSAGDDDLTRVQTGSDLDVQVADRG